MACCFSCTRYEDGQLSGTEVHIDGDLKQPISVVYQTLLKTKHLPAHKTCVEFGECSLTYEQVEDFSTALARDLVDRIGVDPKIENPDGDPVIATIVQNTEKSLVLILAILKTGAAYLPLDPNDPEHVLIKVIETFKPLLIVADEHGPTFNKFETDGMCIHCKLVPLEELWVDLEVPQPHAMSEAEKRKSIQPALIGSFPQRGHTPLEERTAVIFHTKGFKDKVAGVRISHLAIINRCIYEWKHLHWKEAHSSGLVTNFSQVDSLSQIFPAVLKGCTLCIYKDFFQDPCRFLKQMEISMLNRVELPSYFMPDFLNAINLFGRKESREALVGLKAIMITGGTVTHLDAKRYFEIFPKVPLCVSAGGSFETTGEVLFDTFKSYKEFAQKTPVGRIALCQAIQNTFIYILGDEHGIRSDGSQGEICVSGMTLFLGYVGGEEQVREKVRPVRGSGTPPPVSNGDDQEEQLAFVDNPHSSNPIFSKLFYTGEFGRIISDRGVRQVLIEGRKDELIRQKGHEFLLGDIKPFLLELPFAKDAFLYILNKGMPTQEAIAFILVNLEIPPSKVPHVTEIEFDLKEKIPEWALPNGIMLIRGFPKHSYNTSCACCLMQDYLEEREPKFNTWEKDLLMPPDKLDAAITFVKAVYKYASIPPSTVAENLQSSFFEIGGDSFSTLPLLIYLNKNGYEIGIEDFVTAPSMAAVISLIAKKRSDPSSGEKEEGERMREMEQVFDEESIATTTATTVVDGDLAMGQWVKPNFHWMPEFRKSFSVTPMAKSHKSRVIKMIATAYSEKGVLSSYNLITVQQVASFLHELWSSYLEDKLSIVVTDNDSGKAVAVAICQDFFKVVDASKAGGSLYYLLELCQEVKGNIILHLPHRTGETLEIAWMATYETLSPMENVQMITLLHTEVLKLAKERHSGIFHSTSHPLSRYVCTEVFGYDIFEDFPINKYEDLEQSRPFHLASEVICCAALYLKVRDPLPPSTSISSHVIDPVKFFDTLNRKGIGKVKYYHHNSAGPVVRKEGGDAEKVA